MLLFGGGDGNCATFKDAWTFDGETWTQVDYGNPGLRAGIQMAYDSSRNSALTFGGYTVNAGVCNEDSDTWELVLR